MQTEIRETNALFDKIVALVEETRKKVATAVNTAMVRTYFEIGRYIVENEQGGQHRAEYGKAILKELSAKLTERFGKGWSVETLQNIRTLYLSYSPKIVNGVYDFSLSWSHYLVLMRIENLDERNFYEIECKNQDWSVRQLSRQVNSSLYERLALSRNKNEVMALSKKGQTVEKAQDIIKNPLALEFLGLKEDSSYSESKLESAIITKMQDFLLELGKGFLFEARQKRFTFDEEHFFVDLVFYNRLLRCYVLIDLKIDKLTHQDLGQMQMYVNYFDRYVKQDFENQTIGILLCKEKKDTLVELTLPKDSNIFAQEYRLYLPDKILLQQKMKEWIAEFENKEVTL